MNEPQDETDAERHVDDETTEEGDVVLSPPRGRSPAERDLLAKTYPPVPDIETSASTSLQFPIRSLLLLTLAVAVGMAGRTWVSAKVFAGVLALIANLVIFGFELNQIDDHRTRFITIWLCIACGVAVLIALFM